MALIPAGELAGLIETAHLLLVERVSGGVVDARDDRHIRPFPPAEVVDSDGTGVQLDRAEPPRALAEREIPRD